MANDYVDDCIFSPASGGLGNFVYSAAVTGYRPPVGLLVDGSIYEYRAQSADLSQWENGFGVWTSSTSTLARTTISASSNANAAVNFTSPPQVGLTILSASIKALIRADQAQSFTAAQQAQARTNIGAIAYFPPQGRLTLTSLTAVMTTSVAGSATVYYTPYAGGLIPLYDGTNMVPTLFLELSQATTDTTKSPAACAANSVYDIFGWLDTGGIVRATRGPAWTNATTRSAGTALVLVNGTFLNNATITNGPAAQRGTYLGTIGTNASGTVDFIFGSVGPGGVAGVFNVWNAYNRVDVATLVRDDTDTWPYDVANTWRAANGSSTMRVTMVRGLDEDAVQASYQGCVVVGSGTVAAAAVGLDTTTGFTCTSIPAFGTTFGVPASGTYVGTPGIGSHFFSANEFNTTTTASVWLGDFGVGYTQTGLTVNFRA